MNMNTEATKALTLEEIGQASGGTEPYINPMDRVKDYLCKDHRWINQKDLCICGVGQYSELECSKCDRIRYVFNGNEISKKEFYAVWSDR